MALKFLNIHAIKQSSIYKVIVTHNPSSKSFKSATTTSHCSGYLVVLSTFVSTSLASMQAITVLTDMTVILASSSVMGGEFTSTILKVFTTQPISSPSIFYFFDY